MKVAAGLVLILCLLPALALLALALGDPGYRDVLAESRQWDLLWRSLRISGGATLLALAFGSAVAFGVRSLRGAAAGAIETLSLLPLLLPPIAIVMSWIFFCGARGPVRALAGASIDLASEGGAAFILSMCFYPCVSILLLQGLRALDPAWAAVGRMHAGRVRTALRISGPLLAPYAATGAMLVFLLSLGDYGVPAALGVNVYPVEIFTQMSAYYDVPKAVAFAAPPIAIAAILVLARHVLLPPAEALIGHRTRPIEMRPSRIPALLAVPVIAAGALLPCVSLAMTLGSPRSIPEAFAVAGDQAMNSLAISGLGTFLLLGAGAVLAAAIARAGRRGALAAEVLVTLPLVLPGAVVGLGIVVLYANGWMPKALYGGPGAVAYAMICRLVTFPALILAAAFSAIGGRMGEAAALSGAGRLRSAARVTLPLALPGVVSAAVVSFVFCLGELPASALVNPPGSMTLPVRIASLLHFGEDRIVAALCLTLAVLVLGTFALGLLTANRRLELTTHAHRS